MSVYQVTSAEIQRVSRAGKRDRDDSRFAHTGRWQSAKAVRSGRNAWNSCRGQIYSVFSTIMEDARYARPWTIPMSADLSRHAVVPYLFSPPAYTSHVFAYTLPNRARSRLSFRIATAHDLPAVCDINPRACVCEIWLSLAPRPQNAFACSTGCCSLARGLQVAKISSRNLLPFW